MFTYGLCRTLPWRMPAIRAASSSVRSFAGLAEVQPRRGLDAVDAVPEIHLVAVEREDLVLRVALLDLDREDGFLDLPLPRLFVGEEQLAGELLGQRARAAGLPPLEDVLHQRDDDAGNAEAEVLLEAGVFGGEDRLLQLRRDRFVGNDLAPLDRELADDFATRAVDPRDRARRVVVERRDPRQVAGIGEEHAAGHAERRGIANNRMMPARGRTG